MQTNALYTYRKLDVWQDAQGLAAQIIGLINTMPQDVSSREIARQLVRSAGSVPANIAEGHGRYSKGAYRNHLLIARGSLCEVGTWLDLLRRSGYISAQAETNLSRTTDSLMARLTAKARALDN